MDKKIEDAIKYAEDSNRIEYDEDLTEEEKKRIEEMLKKSVSDDSFLYAIVKELEEEKSGKSRK